MASTLASLCVENVGSKFKCSICSDVMRNPVQCTRKHLFCSKCIHEWLKTKKFCPVCRSSLTKELLTKNNRIEHLIGDLVVRCQHSNQISSSNSAFTTPAAKRSRIESSGSKIQTGCEWKGAISSLQNHVENECDFTITSCPNCDYGCTKQMIRKNLPEHLKVCKPPPETIKKCPKGCGVSYRVENAEDHSVVCSEALINCPFGDATSIKRGDFYAHQKDAALQHSEMTVDGLNQVKSMLTAEITKANSAISYLEKELTNIKTQLHLSETLRQAQATQIRTLQESQHVGEFRVSWNADYSKMLMAPEKVLNSEEFTVHVPRAGQYSCFLQICIREEGCVGFYIVVSHGPAFPVTVGIKACCSAHGTQFTVHSMDAGIGLGFPKFITTSQADAIKTENGYITFTTHIKLRSDVLLCLS